MRNNFQYSRGKNGIQKCYKANNLDNKDNPYIYANHIYTNLIRV